MKWFKHEADARNSLKLRKVRRRYGSDGYAIYWFCLEAIAYEVDKDNLTFDLKEDAETIAFELSIQEKRVEEIMRYMVDIGLFEDSMGVITCLKLAERIDKSMTNSPTMRAWLENKNVMTFTDAASSRGDNVSTCPELDKNKIRLEEDNKDPNVPLKTTRKKYKFTDADMRIAEFMSGRVKVINPSAKDPNLKNWANTIRLMREIDNRTEQDICAVFDWANKDSFWCSNILSPDKLRKQFDRLKVKINETGNQQVNEQGRRQSAAERIAARNNAKYGQPGGGLGMAEDGGDIRGAVGPGARRGTVIDVDSNPE